MRTLKGLLEKLIGRVNQLSSEIAALGTQEDIVQQVITAMGTPVFGRVDEENNIILTGELVDGTYTLKYEDAEGYVTEIGKIDVSKNNPSYTNQLSTSVGANGSVFYENGYVDGYRLTGGSPNVDTNMLSENADYFTTGWIPYTIEQAKANVPIYFKGVEIDLTNIQQYNRVSMTPAYNTSTFCDAVNLSDMVNNGRVTLTQLGVNYYKLIPLQFDQISGWGTAGTKYIRFSFFGKGAGVIITIDEPIE